jgi:hypothetical protein
MATKEEINSAVSNLQKEAAPIVSNILDIVQHSNASAREALKGMDPKAAGGLVAALQKSIDQSPDTIKAVRSNIDGLTSSGGRALSAVLGIFATK